MRIDVGAGPFALAQNTVQNRVYVANYLGSSISVIRDVVGIGEEPRLSPLPETPGSARLIRAGTQLTLDESALLLDVSGRRVRHLRSGSNSTAGWAPGLYFVQRVDRSLRKLLVVR